MQYARSRRWLITVLVGVLMAEIITSLTLAGAMDAELLADPGSSSQAPSTSPLVSPLPTARSTRRPAPTIAPASPHSSPTPTPGRTPSPAPVVVPAPPPPPVASGASCASIPAEPGGWTLRVASTFDEGTALGSWPGPVAARDWRSRQAGASDSSGRGTYDSDRTVTEHDGVLDVYVHSEGGTRYVAAIVALLGDTLGQRISVCMRADRIPGYKLAFLLWPSDGNGNDQGEIDFPEGQLTPDGVGNAFMHYDPKPNGDPNKDAYSTGTSTADWHLYTIEWNPGSQSTQDDDYTAFLFDGVLIGLSTGALVPDGPMHYVMQIETYLSGQPLPPPAEGHVLIDWVTISTPY